jgi:Holliday junction resolvase RusA-like endonuclease
VADEGSNDRDSYLVFATKAVLEDPPPISVNKAYSVFKGRLRLTKAGKAYKDALASTVASATTDWKRAHDSIYQHGGRMFLRITLYFEDLLNRSWKPGGMTKGGKKKKKPEAQNPYKKKDASNYIKLIEDAVSRGSGIDDCNNLDVLVRKRCDPKRPRVEITLAAYVADEDTYVVLMDA